MGTVIIDPGNATKGKAPVGSLHYWTASCTQNRGKEATRIVTVEEMGKKGSPIKTKRGKGGEGIGR